MAPTAISNSSQYLAQLKHVALTYPLQLIAAFIVFRLLWNKFQPHLVRIPGPPLAAYTKFWRLYDVWKGKSHITAINVHRKYGPLVRIAPNVVSVADPAMIPVFYNIKENYTKSGFYPIQCISWKKRPEMNLFSTRDPNYHRIEKRKVGHAYSLPNLLESEEAIDSCIKLFMQRLGEFADRREPVDLGMWLQYFAFDVVGEVTFASKLGFLEQGKDVDGMIQAIQGMLAYAALCGQVPEYHKYLLGNPLFALLMPAMETWNQVLVFTLKAINSRASIKRDGELINADTEGRDMLSRWAYVKSSDPNKMNTRDIIVHLSTNVFAGSDTTAIALRAVIYYLCKNPDCMRRVVEEIDSADKQGKLSNPISYKESTTELPYFNAVLKESMRIHPSVGLLMERHVPAEGVEIQGHYIPGGTIVGINPWVTNRDPSIFQDPDTFNPQRWLDASEEKLKQMDNILELNFGGGSRKCIGRNISMIEMQKVLPQLFREFEVELTQPDKEWHICNHWFVQQEGVVCNLTRREKR
ncbi:benzoate 4-monooxygenase cytochrome-like protein P450, partial [Aureobasidium melanogenum]